MSPLFYIFLIKFLRLFFGFGFTLFSGVGGLLYGKRLVKMGITGENYYSQAPLTIKGLIRALALLGIIVGSALWLDKNYLFFSWFGGYGHQFSMVVLKSLIVFLFGTQWAMWEDKRKLKRSIPILVVSFLIMTGIELFTLWPSATITSKMLSDDGVIIQSTGSTCAPSSLANIIRFYGNKCDETEACLAMQTGMNGASDNEMVLGAKALGFPGAVPWRTTLEAIASEDLPLIISIKYFDVWDYHAVAIFGISSHVVTVADPMVGIVGYPRKSFHEIWRGKAVRLGPPSFPASLSMRLSTFEPEKFKKSSMVLELESRKG
ncbi:hypothetical protein HYY75_09100 [bacterium]|nr:hypothetical protein [bacterium]